MESQLLQVLKKQKETSNEEFRNLLEE